MAVADIFAHARVVVSNALIEWTDAGSGVPYVAEGPPFSDATKELWKCSAVYPLSNGGRRIKHAVGLHAPGADGAALASLVYQ